MRAIGVLIGMAVAFAVTPAHGETVGAPVCAVLSLVGNKLDIVATGPSTSRRDAPLKFTDSRFDRLIVRTAGDAIHRALPTSEIVELSATSQALFERQQELFTERDSLLSVPTEISDVLQKHRATHFVLITKHRAAPSFALTNFPKGAGTLDGLGFYLDGALAASPTALPRVSRGNIMSFAYLQVTLIDVATFSVLNKQIVMASAPLSPDDSIFDTANFWAKFPAEKKVRAMDKLINRELSRVIPRLLAPG